MTSRPPVPDAAHRDRVGGDSLLSGGTVSSVPPEAAGKAQFTFATDGTAGGSLGCNRFSAPATVEGSSVAFGRSPRPGWPARARPARWSGR